MTNSQHEGMIKFATKAEKAYRAIGDEVNAEQARKHIEALENMSVCDSCGEWVVTQAICSECGQEVDLYE